LRISAISEKQFWREKEMLEGESGAFNEKHHYLKSRDADIFEEEIFADIRLIAKSPFFNEFRL
jgi:hypothetical protein